MCKQNLKYTKRTLDFLAKTFAEIVVFEEEKENERLGRVIAEDINGFNSNSDSNSSNASLMEELNGQAFDPDKTIINKRYVSVLCTVDKIIQNNLVSYLRIGDDNVRFNTTLLLKKSLDCFKKLDESTYTMLVEVSQFTLF